jgi:uncharacterized protein (DUF433 family)
MWVEISKPTTLNGFTELILLQEEIEELLKEYADLNKKDEEFIEACFEYERKDLIKS